MIRRLCIKFRTSFQFFYVLQQQVLATFVLWSYVLIRHKYAVNGARTKPAKLMLL